MPPAVSAATALAAISPLIASGDFYGAHQKARTFAARYNKSKAYDVAIQVLFESARELLKAGQPGSGTDLAVMMIDIYESSGEAINDINRGEWCYMLIALTGTDGTWRETIINKATAWSAKATGCPAGDPELQYYLGELFHKELNYPDSETHLLCSGTRDSARLLAQVLFEWSRAGADPAAYACRGVMPFLLTTNILAARTFLDTFLPSVLASKPDMLLQKDPVAVGAEDEIWTTNDHTLNFLQMAVRICQRADSEAANFKDVRNVWVRLCSRYVGSVSGTSTPSSGKMLVVGDQGMKDAVISLSHLYFNIQPPRTGPVNPLGDMMASLFGASPPTAGSQPRHAIGGGGRGRGRGRVGGVTGWKRSGDGDRARNRSSQTRTASALYDLNRDADSAAEIRSTDHAQLDRNSLAVSMKNGSAPELSIRVVSAADREGKVGGTDMTAHSASRADHYPPFLPSTPSAATSVVTLIRNVEVRKVVPFSTQELDQIPRAQSNLSSWSKASRPTELSQPEMEVSPARLTALNRESSIPVLMDLYDEDGSISASAFSSTPQKPSIERTPDLMPDSPTSGSAFPSSANTPALGFPPENMDNHSDHSDTRGMIQITSSHMDGAQYEPANSRSSHVGSKSSFKSAHQKQLYNSSSFNTTVHTLNEISSKRHDDPQPPSPPSLPSSALPSPPPSPINVAIRRLSARFNLQAPSISNTAGPNASSARPNETSTAGTQKGKTLTRLKKEKRKRKIILPVGVSNSRSLQIVPTTSSEPLSSTPGMGAKSNTKRRQASDSAHTESLNLDLRRHDAPVLSEKQNSTPTTYVLPPGRPIIDRRLIDDESESEMASAEDNGEYTLRARPIIDIGPARDMQIEISSLMDSAFSASSSPRSPFVAPNWPSTHNSESSSSSSYITCPSVPNTPAPGLIDMNAVGDKARDSLTLSTPRTRPLSHFRRAPTSQSSSCYQTADEWSVSDWDSDPTPVKNPRPRRHRQHKKALDKANRGTVDGFVVQFDPIPTDIDNGLRQGTDENRKSTTFMHTRGSCVSRIPKFTNRPVGSLHHRLPVGVIIGEESHIRQVSSSTFGHNPGGVFGSVPDDVVEEETNEARVDLSVDLSEPTRRMMEKVRAARMSRGLSSVGKEGVGS
ncbi:hypothetical protein FRB98_009060 [Tulasnella sp. 332]|nr:hypothetical protein FRB98_009060 [Tulasnella sp. 332]